MENWLAAGTCRWAWKFWRWKCGTYCVERGSCKQI